MMKATASTLGQEIHEEIQRMPIPPSNVQANVDAKQRQLKRLDRRIEALDDRSGFGEVTGPAWEQKALERLFEVGCGRRPISQETSETIHGTLRLGATRRRPLASWKKWGRPPHFSFTGVITDKGRESIGYPSGR